MVATSSILHEAMVADRQREMRDKSAYHRCLLDAELGRSQDSLLARAGRALAWLVTRAPRRPPGDVVRRELDLETVA